MIGALNNIKVNSSKNYSPKIESDNFSNENNEFQKQKPERFATLFQWDGEGTSVYLTGSFCDWNQFFEMEKWEDSLNTNRNKFILTLYLPKGAYQYKFKIDDQWKCNSNFPTCSDKNGNINNIIDLNKQIKEEGTTDFSTSNITNGFQEHRNDEFNSLNSLNSTKSLLNENVEKNFSFFSSKQNINDISQNSLSEYNYKNIRNFEIPHYPEIFKLKEKLEEEALNRLEENYSYKRDIPLRHEIFDHLILNRRIFIKCNHKHKNKNLISSCSKRYGKFKTTTFIYYRPKLKLK